VRKELFTHLLVTFVFFAVLTLVNKFFNLAYWPLWLGGVAGAFLADLDHLIYVYFLEPNDLNSQRFVFLRNQGNLFKAFDVLAVSRHERTKLILHTALFQVIFLILTYLVVSTSGSLLAKGIVLAFSLHLLVDQFVDLLSLGSLDIWFKSVNLTIDKEKSIFYWLGMLSLLLFIGIVIL
jgi:hypothetical protein